METCQSIYRNLLQLTLQESKGEITASAFVSEVFQTQRCDHFKDLSDLRDRFSTFMGHETTERVLRCEQTERDEDHAYRAVIHYNHWLQQRLRECLTPWNWFKHNMFDRTERFWAFIGIGGVGIASGKKFFQALKKPKPSALPPSTAQN